MRAFLWDPYLGGAGGASGRRAQGGPACAARGGGKLRNLPLHGEARPVPGGGAREEATPRHKTNIWRVSLHRMGVLIACLHTCTRARRAPITWSARTIRTASLSERKTRTVPVMRLHSMHAHTHTQCHTHLYARTTCMHLHSIHLYARTTCMHLHSMHLYARTTICMPRCAECTTTDAPYGDEPLVAAGPAFPTPATTASMQQMSALTQHDDQTGNGGDEHASALPAR